MTIFPPAQLQRTTTDAARRQPRRISRATQLARAEDGQALVEFTLLLPLFLVILFGIIWFGRAYNAQQEATHLANVVARYAAVNGCPQGQAVPCSPTLQSWALSQPGAPDSGSPSNAVVTICFPNGTSSPGDPVQVKVKSNFSWLPVNSFLGISAQSQIGATATMRLESLPNGSYNVSSC
jgi:uncharacterized iron-regulated membrane protein